MELDNAIDRSTLQNWMEGFEKRVLEKLSTIKTDIIKQLNTTISDAIKAEGDRITKLEETNSRQSRTTQADE